VEKNISATLKRRWKTFGLLRMWIEEEVQWLIDLGSSIVGLEEKRWI
jgi:hypothetical protein